MRYKALGWYESREVARKGMPPLTAKLRELGVADRYMVSIEPVAGGFVLAFMKRHDDPSKIFRELRTVLAELGMLTL